MTFVSVVLRAFLLAALSLAALATGSPAPPARPAAQIALSELGFSGIGEWAKLSNEESVTLDFIDSDRLLFTFNPKEMFTRLPDCPPTHEDRMMRAVLIDIHTGRAMKQSRWYLHDHRRYLWPLGSGKFLLRKGNRLYVLDSDLNETLLLDAPEDLLWVSLTPDRKQIIVEKRDDSDVGSGQRSPTKATSASEGRFSVGFLDAQTLRLERTIGLSGLVRVEGTSTGYADALQKNDVWLIRFGPSAEERRNLTRVRSATAPSLLYASNNALIVGRSRPASGEFALSAFTTSGRRLWRQRWNGMRYSPVIVRSERGTRIAIGGLVKNTASSPLPPSSPQKEEAAAETNSFHEPVEVLETATGKPLLSLVNASPVMNGHNFSLSPDGQEIAVLEDSKISLYRLPEIGEEETTQFAALLANTPGLYLKSPESAEIADLPASESDDEAEGASAEPDPLSSFTATLQGNSGGNAPPPPNSVPSPQADGAQVNGDPPDAATTFRVTSRTVAVDVVVTDRSGHPIPGLRPQDFQVMEDGKLQQVRSFEETRDGKTKTSAPRVAMPSALPANVFSNAGANAEPQSSTVVLLDLVNTPPEDQQYARRELIRFLKNKAKDANFALCTLNPAGPSRLRILQGFTRDTGVLTEAASKTIGGSQTDWRSAASATDDVMNNLRQASTDRSSGWAGTLQGLQNMQAQRRLADAETRVQLTVAAMMQLARYLSSVPGRKGVVWLSGSFPLTISGSSDANDPGADSRNFSALVRRVTNVFAQYHVAIYPVDVRGLVAGGPTAASASAISPVGRETPVAPGTLSADGNDSVSPMLRFQQDAMEQLSALVGERSTLQQVAAETGGKAFFSTNAIAEAIATAEQQTSNYYTLSYTPGQKVDDGRFRKIKVSLACRGCVAHYRPGYFAEPRVSPKTGTARRETADGAMDPAAPPSREISFAAQVIPVGEKKALKNPLGAMGDSRDEAARFQHYTIDIAVGASDLGFVSTQRGTRQSTVRLLLAAFDREGRQVSGISSAWNSELSPGRFKDVLASGVRFHQEIDIPVHATALRLGIADQLSTRMGSLEIPLPVPVPPDRPRIVRHRLPEIEPD